MRDSIPALPEFFSIARPQTSRRAFFDRNHDTPENLRAWREALRAAQREDPQALLDALLLARGVLSPKTRKGTLRDNACARLLDSLRDDEQAWGRLRLSSGAHFGESHSPSADPLEFGVSITAAAWAISPSCMAAAAGVWLSRVAAGDSRIARDPPFLRRGLQGQISLCAGPAESLRDIRDRSGSPPESDACGPRALSDLLGFCLVGILLRSCERSSRLQAQKAERLGFPSPVERQDFFSEMPMSEAGAPIGEFPSASSRAPEILWALRAPQGEDALRRLAADLLCVPLASIRSKAAELWLARDPAAPVPFAALQAIPANELFSLPFSDEALAAFIAGAGASWRAPAQFSRFHPRYPFLPDPSPSRSDDSLGMHRWGLLEWALVSGRERSALLAASLGASLDPDFERAVSERLAERSHAELAAGLLRGAEACRLSSSIRAAPARSSPPRSL